MDNNEKKREEILYDRLMKMENGTEGEKLLAFECIGILGNETVDIKLEERLSFVENKIKEYYEKTLRKDNYNS